MHWGLGALCGLVLNGCFKPALERDIDTKDIQEETSSPQDGGDLDLGDVDGCDGDVCAPLPCPAEPQSGPGLWSRVFAEGPLVPVAATRLVSGDLVVAGVVEVGTVDFPDLSEPSPLTVSEADPEAVVAVVRISAESGRAVWLSHLSGRLGGGELPRLLLFGAEDGNAFVLGLMVEGPVDVTGTSGTNLRVDEPAGSAVLIRYEGDGRVRHRGTLAATEGAVYLGTLLSAQHPWLAVSANGPSVPLVDGVTELEADVRSAAVRLSARAAEMPYAVRVFGVAGVQHLAAMSTGPDDLLTTVGFTTRPVVLDGAGGDEVIDSDGRLLRFEFGRDGALRRWRSLQLFEAGELQTSPLFQGVFPWALIDADRGLFVVSEFGGAKSFGEGANLESVVHPRRAVAVASHDAAGRLFGVGSLIHESEDTARTMAAGGQLGDDGLVLWGWSSGVVTIDGLRLDLGSAGRVVSSSWGWDGKLRWARGHGVGEGTMRATAGVHSTELFVFGTVDGRFELAGSNLVTNGPSAFVANLGSPSDLECDASSPTGR